MRWLLEQLTEPELEVVDLAWMKRELREFSEVTSRDDDIEEKIKSAREWIEQYTGRVLVDSTWRVSIERTGDMFTDYTVPAKSLYGTTMPVRDVYLRRSPVLAITSVVTVDGNGEETAVSEDDYLLQDTDGKWPLVIPIGTGTWGAANTRITFRAGFANRTGSPVDGVDVVPGRFKQAMILWVKWNYDGDPANLTAAEAIARPLRVNLGIA